MEKTEADGEPPAPTRVIVKFRPGSTASDRAALHRKNGLTVDRTIPQLQIHAVKIPPNKTAEDVVARYKRHPLVEFVEPDVAYALADVTPNDEYYQYAWHLPQISSPAAWETTTGDSSLVIAVIDSGVEEGHPDLAGKRRPGLELLR